MKHIENVHFNKEWNLIYGDKNKKIEELKKKIDLNKKKSNFNPFNLFELIFNKSKLIIYEKEIRNEQVEICNHNNKHISFLLDMSGSMFTYDRNHPKLKNVVLRSVRQIRNGDNQLINVTRPQNILDYYTVDSVTSIGQCVGIN